LRLRLPLLLLLSVRAAGRRGRTNGAAETLPLRRGLVDSSR
jgi:hypothetical protein